MGAWTTLEWSLSYSHLHHETHLIQNTDKPIEIPPHYHHHHLRVLTVPHHLYLDAIPEIIAFHTKLPMSKPNRMALQILAYTTIPSHTHIPKLHSSPSSLPPSLPPSLAANRRLPPLPIPQSQLLLSLLSDLIIVCNKGM